MGLSTTMDTAVRAYFGGDPAARGIVLDLSVEGGTGYAAVIRTPSGYMVLGTDHEYHTAAYRIESFWDGMRALLEPVGGW